ncbi:unnamed protein product [Toxocara canis]|uniref:MSP domain-containing protein n=1 Tax=Toxocara canis TaxID=6265 RepID=A0A183VGQ4_TOXCA|nr:unnamed protein product [Toxocara canis]
MEPSVVAFHSIAMAQSVPPGDINTQPGQKIVFNAPYDDKHTYHIKVRRAKLRIFHLEGFSFGIRGAACISLEFCALLYYEMDLNKEQFFVSILTAHNHQITNADGRRIG